jgi:hypothetical protein
MRIHLAKSGGGITEPMDSILEFALLKKCTRTASFLMPLEVTNTDGSNTGRN